MTQSLPVSLPWALIADMFAWIRKLATEISFNGGSCTNRRGITQAQYYCSIRSSLYGPIMTSKRGGTPCITVPLWGKPLVTGGFPFQMLVMRNLDVFAVGILNKLLNKQSICRWFGISWHACDITGKCNIVVPTVPLCMTQFTYFLSRSLSWLHGTGWPWLLHYMETLSALLALCEGNPPITVQGPVTRAWMFSLVLAKANC